MSAEDSDFFAIMSQLEQDLAPHDLGPTEEWGQITNRGQKVIDGVLVNFVVVSESPLLDETTYVTHHAGHIVVSSALPKNTAFDKAGHRILTQSEAIANYHRTGLGGYGSLKPTEHPTTLF